MKGILLAAVLLMGGAVFAKTERVEVIKVMDTDDKALIRDGWSDTWLIDLGIGCNGLSMYENRDVVGSYSIDPDSPGAELILPSGSECRIWSAEELNN